MDKKMNSILNEYIFHEKLDSGLECYIIPKKGYVEKQAIIATKYGSLNDNFKLNEEEINMPEGIAHFLEHKMFEDEKINIFDEFTKLGATCNAFTNYNNTAYFFNCIDKFNENLELLLKMVSSVYLTNENVEKEKGIIEQEINMYKDSPGWMCYFNMQRCLYKNLGLKNDIAGSVESIKKIDREMLLKCYETFYRPENMLLICCGDISPDEVFKIAEDKIKSKKDISLEKIMPKEQNEIVKDYIEEKMCISLPVFHIGIKDNDLSKDRSNILARCKLLVDIVAGESSDLYNKLYNEGLIDGSFEVEYVCGEDYGTFIFSGSSKNPKLVLEEILNEIEKIKKNGITENRFNQIKRKHIGRYARSFNSIDNICNLQLDFLTKNMDLFELMDSLNNVTKEELETSLNNKLVKENCVLSVIIPQS